VGRDSGLIGLYLHLTTGQAADPATARTAAGRTTAFYTGTPEPGTGAGQHG
jgi:hypothetical protein